jgi:hypothetical protein
MTLPLNYVACEGDACKCGRRASIRHCPTCGSFRCEGRASLRIRRDNGDVVERYKCMRCMEIFDDYARQFCEAPVYLTKGQKVVEDIKRAHEALISGHPLTEKESQIVAGTSEAAIAIKTQEIDKDSRRKLQAQWVSAKVKGFTNETLELYMERKLKEAVEQNKGG